MLDTTAVGVETAVNQVQLWIKSKLTNNLMT